MRLDIRTCKHLKVILLNTVIDNCILDCPIKNKCNISISNSVAKRKIENTISSSNVELSATNNKLLTYIVSTTSDAILSDFSFMSNNVANLTLTSNGTTVATADVGTLATTAIIKDNINTTSRVVIDTVII